MEKNAGEYPVNASPFINFLKQSDLNDYPFFLLRFGKDKCNVLQCAILME